MEHLPSDLHGKYFMETVGCFINVIYFIANTTNFSSISHMYNKSNFAEPIRKYILASEAEEGQKFNISRRMMVRKMSTNC